MKRYTQSTFWLMLCLACAIDSANAAAASAAPVGLWTTIDDHTHKPRSQVEISEHDGMLTGKVVRIFPQAGEPADPRCENCGGERRDQPVLGMTILWNLRPEGDRWSGGEILDPESGSVYRVTLHPSADGGTLDVRGYVGIALLGRTQVWERASAP